MSEGKGAPSLSPLPCFRLTDVRVGLLPFSSDPAAMSSKQGGKAKPLKQPKAEKKEYDEADRANLSEEERRGKGTEGNEGQGISEGSIWRRRSQEERKEIRSVPSSCNMQQC
ncbi:uncharacterized protein LOC103713772 [Phoenix dactylifera]|uniref:Uncharacterized protein LOC103713772 n=1 Tax=Phoenix dactylifera TaxID=42345 RepID=A0A8B7MV83_PHODC|nr:uncharacterized protein LOC103713772 [Phoenix dactylifera]